MIVIKEKPKHANFSFHEVNIEKIEKEMRRLNKNKAPLLKLLKTTPIFFLNFYAKQ